MLLSTGLFAQRKDLKGQLKATGDVEGIHILNKTAVKFTVSKEDGTFEILAKTSDTLTISGLKYEIKTVIITKEMFASGKLEIQLTEKVNELDEVLVGDVFTGSLESDMENLDAKTEVNFYDLGIPGYTGKPLTQNERKLHDADAGKSFSPTSINVHKLLNKISGRTKKLKKIVALDSKNECLKRARGEYESIIFEKDSLADNLKNEFFFFCDEDPKFTAICKEKNDLKMIDFLKLKLKAYIKKKAIATKE